MGVQGKLTKAKMGGSMPVDAPAYHKPPFYFKQARFIRFDYETDADAASELIPEQLSLADPATASLMLNEYPWSTVGSYREAVLGVNVLYGDQALFYMSHLMLDKTVPVLGGREIGGIPKKEGIVELVQHDDVMAGYVERPRGIRICSGVFRPELPLEPLPDGTPLNTCSLRVIPSPEKEKDHSLVELIQTDLILSSIEMWSGPGNCSFTGASVLDPWHTVPVVKMVASTYLVCDFVIEGSRILETL